MSRQPPANTPLDWSNPLTKGIDWAYNFATGVTGAPSQGKNIITPDIVDFTDSVSNTGQWGFVRHMVTSESATDRWDSKYIASYQTGDMTVMVLCRFPTGATQGTIISQREGANQNWQLYWDTNDLTWRGVGLASIGTGAYEADTWMMIGAYCNGSDTWGYKNGVQLGTSGIYVNSPSTARPISIGHRWDTYPTAAYEGTMHVALAVIWRRQLSAAEHISFAADPWQVFQPQRIIVPTFPYVPTDEAPVGEPNASGTPTITAATASGTAALLATGLTASGSPTVTAATASGYANASNVIITDVNTTESWNDGATGLVITGSGFV